MNRLKNLVSTALMVATLFTMAGCGGQQPKENGTSSASNKSGFKITASFYPMHILSMNLTKDTENVDLTSMSDPNMGCIHDHTFTTEDLKKIENADVFVENGLGLEVFNDKILETYPDVKIAEAGEGMESYAKEDGGDEMNGHIWTNIDAYIKEVENVSEDLQKYDPNNKEKYKKNATEYIASLNKLKEDNKENINKAEGKKALILDETLPAFCQFAKIDAISIETDHEEEALSADTLKETINEMKEKDIKNIFISKDSDRTAAETIAKETGADIYELNTCMVGQVNADEYLQDMKENFEMISKIK